MGVAGSSVMERTSKDEDVGRTRRLADNLRPLASSCVQRSPNAILKFQSLPQGTRHVTVTEVKEKQESEILEV